MYLIDGKRIIGNGGPIVKEDTIERISDTEFRCEGTTSTGTPFSGKLGDDGMLYITGVKEIRSYILAEHAKPLDFQDNDGVKHKLLFKDFKIEYLRAGDTQISKLKQVLRDDGRMRLTLNDTVIRLPLSPESRDVLEHAKGMKALQDRYNLRRAGFFYLQVARLHGSIPLASWSHPTQFGDRTTEQLKVLSRNAKSVRPSKDVKKWSALQDKLHCVVDEQEKLLAVLYLVRNNDDYPTDFAQGLLMEVLDVAHALGMEEVWSSSDDPEHCLQYALESKLDDLLDKYFDVEGFVALVTMRDEVVSVSAAVTGAVVVELKRTDKAITLDMIRAAVADARNYPRAGVKLLSDAWQVLEGDDVVFAPGLALESAEKQDSKEA